MTMTIQMMRERKTTRHRLGLHSSNIRSGDTMVVEYQRRT